MPNINDNYNKILESDWLSAGPIGALIGQYMSFACAVIKLILKLKFKCCPLFTCSHQKVKLLAFFFSQILLVELSLIGNRTLCRPILL